MFWFAIVAFGIAVLLVAIAAGRATRVWERVLLLILNFVFEAGVFVSLAGEVWFLAKTIMAAGMGAAGALLIAIVVALALIAPAIWLIRQIVSTGYGLLGRRAQFRSDFGGSLWVNRTGTWRPRDL